MNAREGSGPSEAIQDAAVIGVVIAGVLASFTIPGPFDWGSSLIGVILLFVLVAYGSWPPGLTWANIRRAMGMATAAAFCLLLVIARPLDVPIDSNDGRRRLLSHWPVPSTKRDDDVPNPGAGWELLVLWFALFGLLILIWATFEWRKAQRTAVG